MRGCKHSWLWAQTHLGLALAVAGGLVAGNPRCYASEDAPAGKIERTISGEDSVATPEKTRTNPTLAAPVRERDEQLERRGVSLYDGTWRVTSPPNHCGIGLTSKVQISNGVIRGPGGGGHVSADGSMSGRWSFVGIVNASLVGRMSSATSGGGSWRNSLGCGGYWTISRL
jgi:hypothetical protein